MGPSCPHCNRRIDWTMGEILEDVLSPKIYTCEFCRGIWVMDPDEVRSAQTDARHLVAIGDDQPSETPEDWARIKKKWDAGEPVDDDEEYRSFPW